MMRHEAKRSQTAEEIMRVRTAVARHGLEYAPWPLQDLLCLKEYQTIARSNMVHQQSEVRQIILQEEAMRKLTKLPIAAAVYYIQRGVKMSELPNRRQTTGRVKKELLAAAQQPLAVVFNPTRLHCLLVQ